jgi:hypothetical protein
MPKKLKYSKKIKQTVNEFIENVTIDDPEKGEKLLETIDTFYSKINKEYMKELICMVDMIALGENLDANMLREKYLQIKKPDIVEPDDTSIILDKIIIDGMVYYCEQKEDGNVYNSSSIIVGTKENNIIKIHTTNA